MTFRLVPNAGMTFCFSCAGVLPAAGDDLEEIRVVHALHRIGDRRRVARAHAVRPVADVAVGMVAAIAGKGVPIDGAVLGDLEGRVAVRVEDLAVLLRWRLPGRPAASSWANGQRSERQDWQRAAKTTAAIMLRASMTNSLT